MKLLPVAIGEELFQETVLGAPEELEARIETTDSLDKVHGLIQISFYDVHYSSRYSNFRTYSKVVGCGVLRCLRCSLGSEWDGVWEVVDWFRFRFVGKTVGKIRKLFV